MSITNEAIIERLISRSDLDSSSMNELLERIFSGAMPPAQIAATLALLRAKKESSIEIACAADAIIKRAEPIERPDYLYADIVGTGGDGHNTINVSTLASLTVASLGVPVAKHGSVSVSSKCGSADVLLELGVNISATPEKSRQCLDKHLWCFLYAPLYHPTYRSVKSLRHELRIRTIFNILGPLVNPLAPPIMLIGVYDPALMRPFFDALKNLGRKRILIVHGSGLDEIALHGPTSALLLDDRSEEKLTFGPSDLGLKEYSIDDIKGGGPEENAKLCKEILSGTADDAKIAMVAASAGALLWLSEKASTIKEGVRLAEQGIRAQKPMRTLESIVGFSYGA